MGTTTLRRRQYLRAVLQVAQTTGDTVAPWKAVGDMDRHFEDEADLLVELHAEWVRLLVGRLHRGRIVPERTPANVRDVHQEVCRAHPTLRAILDAREDDPALREATAREHAMLARIAGLASEDTLGQAAAGIGLTLIQQRLPVQRSVLV